MIAPTNQRLEIVGNPMMFNDVMLILGLTKQGLQNKFEIWPVSLDLVFTMSKIGHLQNCLEEIFDEFTPKVVNKMLWIQLQYCVEKNKRILVVVKVLRKEAEKETLKSDMYVTQLGDLDFLWAYLAKLSITLAT